MSNSPAPDTVSDSLQRLAGYLNFSSGACDGPTLTAWNHIYAVATDGDPLTGPAPWLVIKDWLTDTLESLSSSQAAFRDVSQGNRVIQLLWSELLPTYLDFHRDLLFHQEPEVVFNGFFMARAAEAILGADWNDETEIVVDRAIRHLNDFVGYRPVAILKNRTCEPYPHEFVRPIPLYIKGVGVSAGPYFDVITMAIETLQDTDEDILRSASFDIEQLHELALDPRAYDFDHPVNRRPNYHFGAWDTRTVSSGGYFTRYVVRQVTLDALLNRLDEITDLEYEELLVEAASVLAGTILMGSGISGWGPGAYTSDVTLGSLMKPIAAYRDAFYNDRMQRISGPHSERLTREQQHRRQPFGAARQHLNAALAQRRAAQLQHVQLARLYARMGYPDAAKRQSDTVPATSARMMCRIDCEMTLGLRALRSGDLEKAVQVPSTAIDLIKRGIDCGALIDPWDILGFGGNFSLYPGPECGVHDSRVDDLLYLIEQLFGYMARVWSEAAAQNNEQSYTSLGEQYRDIAEWWRQFAAHTIESIDAADPLESYDSAKLVARALRLWHVGGAEAGNVAFWAPHADLFDSPRAYALVISALLEREDFVPAMALLIHWLGNGDRIGLRQGGNSLPRLAERWLLRLRSSNSDGSDEFLEPLINQSEPKDTAEIWPLVRKFFDYLEANAEEFWSAPTFTLGNGRPKKSRDWDQELTAVDESDDEEGLYDAAYEGMTYRDTTDDGNDGAVFEFGDEGSTDELEAESKRLLDRLSFLQSLARMWAVAADITVADYSKENAGDRLHALQSWADRACQNRIGLLELLDAVRNYTIKPAGSDKDSMRSYDRSRVLRDSLMERIIGTAVEMSDARRLICGALLAHQKVHPQENSVSISEIETMGEDDAMAVKMFAALISGDAEEAKAVFPDLLDAIRDKSLLYIPLSRGGDPVKIHLARLRQRVLRHLMHWLPRRGLFQQACLLIETARLMEQNNSVGVGAVTEFDSLFQAGFRSLVASLVESTRRPLEQQDITDEKAIAEELIPLLERLTETLLASWLDHSRTLRLSPLETVADPKKWSKLVQFVKDYGDPIFTQMFLQLGNVRAILHQGVTNWLKRVLEDGEDQLGDTRFYEDLESGVLSLQEADKWITLVYEALIDHHAEYQDYNSTTTQSDRGDLIYMFMDFLRLRTRYERIAWNLKPVMWAHEVLVRTGLESAAMMWRRSLSERIGTEADLYVKRLRELQRDYSMRMPTVADRILERFVQPMTIARMRALVGPAMRDAEKDQDGREFDLLEQESDLLTRTPTGAGLDLPAWLDALEEEVEKLAKRRLSSEIDPQALMTIPILPLTKEELDAQLAAAKLQGRGLPPMDSAED